MTREEAIERYTSNAEYERTHGNLQGCLEFRQLAEWLKELKTYRETQVTDAVDRVTIKEYLESMQCIPAKEKSKMGKWIKHTWDCFECNICGNRDGGTFPYRESKYCPDCGAEMNGTIEKKAKRKE